MFPTLVLNNDVVWHLGLRNLQVCDASSILIVTLQCCITTCRAVIVAYGIRNVQCVLRSCSIFPSICHARAYIGRISNQSLSLHAEVMLPYFFQFHATHVPYNDINFMYAVMLLIVSSAQLCCISLSAVAH